MPEFSVLSLSFLLGIVLVVELATFWAAASLADVPPLGWGKFLLTGVLATAGCGLLAAALGWFSGVAAAPLAPENQATSLAVVGGTALGVWLLPALLYVPLASLSLRGGLIVSVFQFLLRAFVYALLAAVVMLALAGLQVYFGIDVRAEAPALAGLLA